MLRRISRFLGALSLTLAAVTTHAAYPDKPVRLVVPWAPGGSKIGRASCRERV